ncbi:methyl-accepting chemotaxis protein-2 (aspartate sensor receptor) [Inhella inkyongensis]|uniref:Methyl-accepting chemotaxis protein-2 (Aspartate sensor receptor) n=2 Tax=Inhella inkyongensis TaxID=392593 RepID=A0A840SBP1_9BURK|nr:methyl-accepting chemotaxis protein [Inhella inkyongensis]MBB5205881.1 methyl-accepting chemotaxis protein-2 (aspartate sensor receptor) [Inhella inkyongensis]
MSTGQASLARRVSLIGVGAIAAVLFLTSLLLSVMLLRSASQSIETWASDRTQAVEDSITAMDDTARTLVRRSFGAFRQEFGPQFSLDEATGELRDWGPKLNENYTAVDKFAASTGGVATVFARQGDDFIRITTSVKKPDGSRALGTPLGKTHPGYADLSAGKSFTGRANLFGRAYMAHYEPVKSEDGKIIGILFVGYDLDVFTAALDRMVKDIHFFDSGGVVVINNFSNPDEASFTAHPSAKGKKLSEVAPELAKTLAQLPADAHGERLEDMPDVLGRGGTGFFGIAHGNPASGLMVLGQVKTSEARAQQWATLLPFWALLAAATVALGFGLFYLMRQWVARPMAKLSTAVQAVASGDLSQSVTSARQDEIGQLIRDTETMRARLSDTISTVRHSVDSIGTASREIATGNQDLSQRTEQTASNLQIAASSMEEFTGTVRQTADSARTANQLVASTASAAAKGGQVVAQVVSTMEDISQSSRKIADIIGVIDGIAFQTNILALNAAVEAARAGEQGRGFAVVASEVRSLAGRSAEAAKEIKTLIGASVERVEVGSRLVQEAGSSMTEIVSGVQRVADIMAEIAAAAAEQSDGISQVNDSVVQLDQMTQQNAALVEQSAAAAESLRDQAQRLVEAVAVFRTADTPPTAQIPKAPQAQRPVQRSPVTPPKAAATPKPAPPQPPARPAPSSAASDDWESF